MGAMIALLRPVGCQAGGTTQTRDELPRTKRSGTFKRPLSQEIAGRFSTKLSGPRAEKIDQGLLVIGDDDFKKGARSAGNAEQLCRRFAAAAGESQHQPERAAMDRLNEMLCRGVHDKQESYFLTGSSRSSIGPPQQSQIFFSYRRIEQMLHQ